MRGLAEWALRGPRQAICLATLFACIPMLFWVSSAIIALVVLRRGVDQGVKILAWTLLPGIAWAAMGQFATVAGLLAATALAFILRQTVSWQKTLLALLPVGALMALAIAQLAPRQIDLMTELVLHFIGDQRSVDIGSLKLLVKYGVIGMLTWFNLVTSVLGLVLARSWQAQLFNPGGFREEFHQIRLPVAASVMLLMLSLGGSTLAPMMLVIAPIASLPLLVAGLALMHGLVGIRKLNNVWLVTFYMLLIMITQLVYPVIVLTACLDSWFDFRGRLVSKLHQG